MAAVKKTFDIALDIADAGANREFTVVDGDNGNVLAILLTDGGYPVDLTGCRVIAVFSKSDGTACQDSYDADGGITLCGTLNNQVDIELFAGSVAPGTVECELQIYSDPSLSREDYTEYVRNLTAEQRRQLFGSENSYWSSRREEIYSALGKTLYDSLKKKYGG